MGPDIADQEVIFRAVIEHVPQGLEPGQDLLVPLGRGELVPVFGQDPAGSGGHEGDIDVVRREQLDEPLDRNRVVGIELEPGQNVGPAELMPGRAVGG